jgi:hypothetical protein
VEAPLLFVNFHLLFFQIQNFPNFSSQNHQNILKTEEEENLTKLSLFNENFSTMDSSWTGSFTLAKSTVLSLMKVLGTATLSNLPWLLGCYVMAKNTNNAVGYVKAQSQSPQYLPSVKTLGTATISNLPWLLGSYGKEYQ